MPKSRYRLTDNYTPVHASRVCYLCKVDQRELDGAPERIIDTDVEVYGEGHIAVCETCVREMNIALGYPTPTAHNKLVKKCNGLASELSEAWGRADLAEHRYEIAVDEAADAVIAGIAAKLAELNITPTPNLFADEVAGSA